MADAINGLPGARYPNLFVIQAIPRPAAYLQGGNCRDIRGDRTAETGTNITARAAKDKKSASGGFYQGAEIK